MNWKQWLKGLVASVISSVASVVAVVVADPEHFNPMLPGSFRKLGVVALVAAIVGGAMYLKEKPTP